MCPFGREQNLYAAGNMDFRRPKSGLLRIMRLVHIIHSQEWNMSISADRIDLSDNDAELLAQASRIMSEALDRPQAHRIALVEQLADGSDSARFEVPPATLRLLSQILALMARQQTFVLYPESSELTTKQAAEVLGVSRPFLIRVLEAGEIPYRKVGRHRRVLMKDVLLHKQANQVKRRAALDELVRTSEEVGGYDL
jgi:excisionase family DNA binding protein